MLTKQQAKELENIQNIANNLKYPNNSPAEGIVIRSTIPFYSVYLEKEWSVKIINQNYKE